MCACDVVLRQNASVEHRFFVCQKGGGVLTDKVRWYSE